MALERLRILTLGNSLASCIEGHNIADNIQYGDDIREL